MNRSPVSWLTPAMLTLLVLSLLSATATAQANLQGQWTTLPTLMPINPVHVALLRTGKVLVVAGSGNDSTNTNYQAAIWDPLTDTVTTQSVSWDMFCNGMVVLPDGRPFITGGTLVYDPFRGISNTAVYDPLTGIFTNKENMAHGRWYPTSLVLGDGRVMTFSGVDETGATNMAVELYTVGAGWSQQYIAPWTPPLYPRMHLLPNGQVFYSGWTTSSSLFDPSTQTWSLNIATTNFGNNRIYGSSVLLPLTPANNYDPKVMILGGSGPATLTTEIIDLGSPSPAWQWGPNMSQPRIELNTVILPDGKVLATGGSFKDEDGSTASLNADLYDPASNLFVVAGAGANAFPRLYHSVALLLPDATVWLAGGNPSRGSVQQEMEIYQPAYLFTTDLGGHAILAPRPTIASAPATVTWGTQFTVQTPDAANISSVVLVRNSAVTHAFNMDQRLVGMSFTPGSGSLTVTAPPSGNIAPPGYYMLFLLNNAGVPSVASFVQVTAADFSVSATPPRLILQRGSSVNFRVTVGSISGFAGVVTLDSSGLPPGTKGAFNHKIITGSGTSMFRVSANQSATPGIYTLTISGLSGTVSHSTIVSVKIQ